MGLAETFWKSKVTDNFLGKNKVSNKSSVSDLSWHELRAKAKELDIKFKDMKRPELEQAVLDAIK